MKTVLLIAVLLSGCAITPEQSRNWTNFQLCSAALDPVVVHSRQDARDRLAERGENCAEYQRYRAVSTGVSANNAAAGAAIMNNSRTYSAPSQQTCNATYFQGIATTQCY